MCILRWASTCLPPNFGQWQTQLFASKNSILWITAIFKEKNTMRQWSPLCCILIVWPSNVTQGLRVVPASCFVTVQTLLSLALCFKEVSYNTKIIERIIFDNSGLQLATLDCLLLPTALVDYWQNCALDCTMPLCSSESKNYTAHKLL